MMKKLYYSVLTFLSVVCLAIGVMLMTGVGYGANKANATTVTGQTPTFSTTKYMVSSDGESILFVTAIGNCDDVYSVGYSIVIDPSLTAVNAPAHKYYTSLTIGGNTWTTEDLFGAGYTGMIVGEYTGYTRNAAIKAKIYAHVGDREDDVLVESATTEWGTEINPVMAFDSEGVVIYFPEPVDTDKKIAVDVKFTSASSTEIDFFLRGAGDGNWLKGFGNIYMYADGRKFNDWAGVSVADIGDGWYRITIDMANVTKIFTEKPAQVAAFEVKGGSGYTTASGYIAYMGVVEPDIHEGAVAFDSNGVTINFPEPVDTDKTIAVDVKFTSAGSTEIDFFLRGAGDGNWLKGFGNIYMYADGRKFNDYTGISVADIGDDWYRITIDMATATKIFNEKPAQIAALEVKGGSGYTTASGYIAYMGVVEPDIHAGAVAFDSEGVIINFPEPVDTDKTIAVDVKFTSAASTEIDFFIRGTDGPNSNYYGNIWMKPDGTRFDYYTGISVADIGDGWYRITIDLAAANKITGTKPAQVGDFRVVGGSGYTTASGYIAYMGVVD